VSYARNLLSRGEEVVFESRQHWFAVIARTWLWILIAVLAFALLIFLNTNQPIGNATVDQVLTIVSLGALLVSIVMVALVIWDWRNQEWLITTRRVIRAEGILNKSMSDSNLEKINDAMLTQSLVGRIFGYGTLDILTAAEEIGATASLGDFPMLADPVDFKKAMLNQKEMLERPDLAPPRYQRSAPLPEMQPAEPMPPRAGSAHVSEVLEGTPPAPNVSPTPPAEPPSAARPSGNEVADTLERLAALRDKGLITPEEYEAKKRELLERM
jgi:Bacterial PH domain/Short C-terminal domain